MTDKSKKELLEEIQELKSEIEGLKDRKKYGLVWEDKEQDVVEQCKNELPVLREIKSRAVNNNDGKPTHLMIEGDNYHALQVLNYTHKGKVDVIYIDPPYNTGNESWRYNNNYVEEDDDYKHSKWLSMMEKRVKASKKLLADDGVFVITIDDYEVFTLGMLLDEIFGEKNRLGIVAAEINPRGRTTNSNFATSHEYIFFYSRNSEAATIFDLPLTEEQKSDFNHEDDISEYRILPFRRSGGLSTPDERPN